MNNWKEKFDKIFHQYNTDDWEDDIQHFIETEIIEKLIEDIQEEIREVTPPAVMIPGGRWADDYNLKATLLDRTEQLRASWLGKETHE